MSSEISFTASISCYKPSIMTSAIGRSITALLRNMTGTTYIQDSLLALTSATVVPLGSVTSPHWAYFCNMDPTNYVKLMNGAAGAVFLRLLAGDCAFCPLDPACVPYAIADTASCQLEYMILAG